MYPPLHQDIEYSHHPLCLFLVNCPFKPEADTMLNYLHHHRLVLPVIELHNKGIILFYLCLYFLCFPPSIIPPQDCVCDIHSYCYL